LRKAFSPKTKQDNAAIIAVQSSLKALDIGEQALHLRRAQWHSRGAVGKIFSERRAYTALSIVIPPRPDPFHLIHPPDDSPRRRIVTLSEGQSDNDIGLALSTHVLLASSRRENMSMWRSFFRGDLDKIMARFGSSELPGAGLRNTPPDSH